MVVEEEMLVEPPPVSNIDHLGGLISQMGETLVEPPPVSNIDHLGGLISQMGETLDVMLAAISIDNNN